MTQAQTAEYDSVEPNLIPSTALDVIRYIRDTM